MSLAPAGMAARLGQGLLSFPVTHFDGRLAFDEPAFRAHCARLLEHDIAGLFAAGGTGEFFSLTPAEVGAVALPYLAMGVTAYSSAIFNFLPSWALTFYRAVRASDRAYVEAELSQFVLPYVALRNRSPGYAVSIVKAGLTVTGQPAGPVRPPLTDLGDDESAELLVLIGDRR